MKDARVEYRLKRHGFLFGTAIAHAPFADNGEDGRHYRQFILDHFNALVSENEMKWYATDASFEAANDAIQIHGAYGYSDEYDVERYFRDAPLMIVGEGTNEIQRNVIAAQLVARGGI